MVDIFTREKRSHLMSKIRGRGNKDTELALIDLFRRNKIVGWRRNYPAFGKPDFVFTKPRIAVFVDGCFWHVCHKHCKIPESNRLFWEKKLKKNQTRDRIVNRTLKANGWRVIRIWEHSLSRSSKSRTAKRVISLVNKSEKYLRG
jgi:DNA mismatch endonuclease (patch repair protein)